MRTNQLPEPDHELPELAAMRKAKKITDYKEFIAYYGKQAAYWEQRLKELDMTETNELPPLPTAKFTETIRGVPCITVTERELELIDGMIAVHLDHAQRCDAISNRDMAEKQKGWDMERVELLRRIRSLGITAHAQVQGEVCPTCGETEPYTGSCGTSNNDTKALCKKPANATQAAMTDEQISLEAHNADDRDWNDLRFRSSWHEGFSEGARFAEAHHGITAKEGTNGEIN